MRHGDDRAGVFLEMALQPGDGLGVEVVGRLVEQEDVRLTQQQAAEGDATAFAAGENGDGRIAGRAAQGIHRQFEPAVQVPSVECVEPVLDFGLARHQFVHLLGGEVFAEAHVDGVELGQGVHDFLHAFLYDLACSLGVVEVRLLFQVADGEALGENGMAVEVLLYARHDAQQRALAGAVKADDADFGPVEVGEADVAQDLVVGRVGLAHAHHRVDDFVFRHDHRLMSRLPVAFAGHSTPRAADGERREVRGGLGRTDFAQGRNCCASYSVVGCDGSKLFC